METEDLRNTVNLERADNRTSHDPRGCIPPLRLKNDCQPKSMACPGNPVVLTVVSQASTHGRSTINPHFYHTGHLPGVLGAYSV